MVNCVDADPDWIDKTSRIFKPRVKEANGRYDRYKLESVPSRADVLPIPTVVGGRKPDLLVGLHAKGGAFETLCNTLTDGDEQLKVLSVVGVGGIGKTTLAKQLWREHKHGDYFDCRAFVRTAKKPDMRRILRSILAQVRPDQPPDANEVHELIHDLTEHLKDKRYFLIIDDLWATSVWDVATRAFPEGNHGSRIITTTEIEDVALACCSYQSQYILKMEPLSDSHSKELFSSAVFGSREQHSHQLDEVSDEIIRRCAGLPQAIISISSVLSSHGEENTVENWEQIQNSLPNNTTSDEILKQVLNFCYNSLPSCVQTCLLYLSIYPENYIILKEDIVKQWVAEGFICEPTKNGEMKVAESYFDKLVDMGMIQQIDVNYSDEVLYYAVHHTVHDFVTSKSKEENFVTVIDYSRRTVRISNKVSHLSLQFGSATYATTPPSIRLPQVRSLAYTGLSSCLPPDTISEFKLLRLLILHIWDDQPSTGVDLRGISKLLLLRYLQVTCNGTVHLPDQLQALEHLETLDINARVAAIPLDIVHLRHLLHLRLGEGTNGTVHLPLDIVHLRHLLHLHLGEGTELSDVTGILKNDTLNPSAAILLGKLDGLNSTPESLKTIEILLPIFRIPKWIGHLTKLRVLKIVVRELPMSDISNLQGLPSLTVLSLYVQQRITELIDFATGAFSALEYFEFRCGVLCLMFHEGAMPNLQRLKLGFNACRGEQYSRFLNGVENLSNVQEISGIIGIASGANEHDFQAAESAFMKAVSKLPSKVSIKRAAMVEEECGPAEKQHVIQEKDASSRVKSEQPAILKQDSEEDIKQNAGGGLLSGIENLSNVQEISGIIGVATGAEEHEFEAAESALMKAVSKHPSKVSVKRADMVEEEYGPAKKQHVIQENDALSHVKSEQPAFPKQASEKDIKQNPGGDSQFIQSRLRVIAELRHGDLFHSPNIVSSIEFDRDDELFATAGVSKRIKVFEFSTVVNEPSDVHCPVVEMATRSKLSCLSWNKYSKNVIASSDYEGIVTVWDVQTCQSVMEYKEHEKRAWSVDFSRTEPKMLVSGSDDCKVKVWCTNQEASTINIDMKANICSVKYNPGSSYYVAVGSADHHIHYFDLRNPSAPLHVFGGHKKAVSYVKFLSNNELASASTDSTLRLWDVKDNCPLRTFSGHKNEKHFVGLSVNNEYIACGSETNEVFVYHKAISKPASSHRFLSTDLDDADEVPGSYFISAVCWKSDSPTMLTASSQGTIKVLVLAP